jgi:hypothetical protein
MPMNNWNNLVIPNREAICLSKGLNADCSPKTTDTEGVDRLKAYERQSKPPVTTTSSKKEKATKIAIGVGVGLIVLGTIIYFVKKK